MYKFSRPANPRERALIKDNLKRAEEAQKQAIHDHCHPCTLWKRNGNCHDPRTCDGCFVQEFLGGFNND